MDDFYKQQAGWLNTWQEQQQKLAQQYAQWGEDLTKGLGEAGKQRVPLNFEALLKTQQELFEQFTSFGAELQQKVQQTWGDKLPAEILKQFNFSLLQEFYKNWLGTMKFPGGMQNPFMGGQSWADPASFLNSFMKQENPFFGAFSSNNLMDELQKMLGMLQGPGMMGGGLYSQMFSTFQGYFNQLANNSSTQGFDKLLETFSAWKSQADKYLLAPQVGINREVAQDFSKVISLSFDYMKANAVMGKLMEETARKAGNRFQAKLVERTLNNEEPIKFSDFCSLWTKENEAVFLDVFGDEEYARTQQAFTSSGLRLKMQLNMLAEKVLDQTPIALKRDVDLASKEILQLKRDLRHSRKQQQLLAAEAKTARESVTASEKRIQALESALGKVQALAEKAELAAKTVAAQQAKAAPKAAASKATAAPAKKTTAAAPKKTTTAKSATTTAKGKKPAATPVESVRTKK